MNRLREHRLRFGLTQDQVVEMVRARALERGGILPGLDRVALSKHERGIKRPGPYYQRLYGELFNATPAELGFRRALPGENEQEDDVDRREFLMSTAGAILAAALPSIPTRRIDEADIARLRQSVVNLYALDHNGAGGAYTVATGVIGRLRGLAEHATYNPVTGRALCELTGLTAEQAGWMAFDAGRHDDARRWFLEALQWSHLAESDSVGIVALSSMALQASDQRRPRETIDLAQAAQRMARSAPTPRLTSALLAREALGHAGRRDAASAHAVLSRARGLADQTSDDDPTWLDFYGPSSLAGHEYRVAMMLDDLPAAEAAARVGLELNDAIAYPRAQALFLIQLADVLVRRRNIDEAAAVTKQAAVAAADLDSGRVTSGLQAVTRSLQPFTGHRA